jgi:hypothetical protein
MLLKSWLNPVHRYPGTASDLQKQLPTWDKIKILEPFLIAGDSHYAEFWLILSYIEEKARCPI